MVNFFGWGRSDPAKDEEPKSMPTAQSKAAAASVTHNDKQREMIRLALSGVLRRHGIASHWISCEFLPIRQPDGPDGFLVQLLVRNWHDGLVLHAPEMQREFFQEIHLFDKSVDAANFPIVWKFPPDCGYPNGKLPTAEYWVAKPESGAEMVGFGMALPASAAVTAVAATVMASPKKFDLPPSHLDEDDGDDGSGFAPTQMRDDL